VGEDVAAGGLGGWDALFAIKHAGCLVRKGTNRTRQAEEEKEEEGEDLEELFCDRKHASDRQRIDIVVPEEEVDGWESESDT